MPGRIAQAADRPRCRPGRTAARSALASLSLHLARSTNIDSRFSVAAAGRRCRPADRVGAGQTMKAGQQPALGRAVAGQAAWPCARLQDVLRQLAVQEAGGRQGPGRGSRPSRCRRSAPSAKVFGQGRVGWLACAIIISPWLRRPGAAAKWLAACVAAAAGWGCGSGGRAWWWLERPLTLARAAVELSIEPGTTPREVAQAWVAPVCDVAAAAVPVVPLVGAGAAHPCRQLRDRQRHHAAPACWTRWCRATRRSADGAPHRGLDLAPVRSGAGRRAEPEARHAGLTDAAADARAGCRGTSRRGRLLSRHLPYSRGVSDLTVLQARARRDAATATGRGLGDRAPTHRCAAPSRR
jgi:hypothetical protein